MPRTTIPRAAVVVPPRELPSDGGEVLGGAFGEGPVGRVRGGQCRVGDQTDRQPVGQGGDEGAVCLDVAPDGVDEAEHARARSALPDVDRHRVGTGCRPDGREVAQDLVQGDPVGEPGQVQVGAVEPFHLVQELQQGQGVGAEVVQRGGLVQGVQAEQGTGRLPQRGCRVAVGGLGSGVGDRCTGLRAGFGPRVRAGGRGGVGDGFVEADGLGQVGGADEELGEL